MNKGNAQGQALSRKVMFQTIGSHGLELASISTLVIQSTLLLIAFGLVVSERTSTTWNSGLFVGLLAFGVASRIFLQPLPNIQPVTLMIFVVGAVLGWRVAVSLAIFITLLSNVVMGDGYWTVFQSLGWSVVGLIGARTSILTGKKLNMPLLLAWLSLSALVFDVIVTCSLITSETTITSFVTLCLLGLPYDLLHMAGNALFAVTFGQWLTTTLLLSRGMSEPENSVVTQHVNLG